MDHFNSILWASARCRVTRAIKDSKPPRASSWSPSRAHTYLLSSLSLSLSLLLSPSSAGAEGRGKKKRGNAVAAAPHQRAATYTLRLSLLDCVRRCIYRAGDIGVVPPCVYYWSPRWSFLDVVSNYPHFSVLRYGLFTSGVERAVPDCNI